MKKLLSLLVVAAMTVSLCACGGNDSTGDASGEATTDTAAENEEAAGDEANAGTEAEGDVAQTEGDSAPAGNGVMPAIAKEDLKIGVIHITDPAEGSGYTYTHDLGIQGMQKNLGLEDSQIVRKNNVNDTDATAIENAIRECVEDGCNVIFATSWGFMDTCEALADEFPEIIFSHGTGYKSNGVNFNNYFGRIYQARYLAGIAAGLKTESNKLGYVAAMGQD
ncbi:MAG: BMP family ABC transporter substrate-binding protein, partial [Lachnospiraceae bacterium]|nr:BMP family ABC transporter substrate-binding protein [Lachnospiraceae bacterium]